MKLSCRNSSTKTFVACFALAFAALALPSRAHAEFLGNLLEIQVSAGPNTGSYILDVPVSGNPFVYNLSEPFDIFSSQNPGTLLATIDGFSLSYDGDPQIILNFAVTAGNANTAFSISSALVAFPSLTNPQASATAAITVTDNGTNGGTATGTFPGVKSYEATYNGGSLFADLVSPVIAPPGSSGIGSERFPVPIGSTIAIPGSVTSMAAEFSFVLTANDSASGTSNFTIIVPEPSSILLALAGGVALMFAVRRRK
jgi:hypothetical protein